MELDNDDIFWLFKVTLKFGDIAPEAHNLGLITEILSSQQRRTSSNSAL